MNTNPRLAFLCPKVVIMTLLPHLGRDVHYKILNNGLCLVYAAARDADAEDKLASHPDVQMLPHPFFERGTPISKEHCKFLKHIGVEDGDSIRTVLKKIGFSGLPN